MKRLLIAFALTVASLPVAVQYPTKPVRMWGALSKVVKAGGVKPE
jgi:hypothetical protein